MRRRGLAFALASSAALASWPAAAFPERPITMITGYGPGGSTDIAARLLADRMAAHLGPEARVVVENRPGAAGTVATEWLKRQPPDGHVVMVTETGAAAAAPAALIGGTRYDPVADFTHLGMLVDSPSALLVTAKSPHRTLEGLLDAARKGSVRYGSSGVGSSGHLLGEVLAKDARAPRLDHVPYRGSAPGLQDLMAGAIESLIDPLTTNMGMLKDGTLRALAVTTARRMPALPDVPSFEELGYPRLTAGVWIGLSGPRGLPAPIAERITAEIPKVLARPDLRQRFDELASYPPEQPLLGAEYARYIADFAKLWTAVAREANITAS